MRAKEKTVPLNISVPQSLKDEMIDHPEINWSAVAAKAFRMQLKAQKFLSQFAEEGVSDEEASKRILDLERKNTVTKSIKQK